MRILYVLNDTFKKGGTESVVLNYFYHLDREKYMVDFMIHTTIDEAETNGVYLDLTKKGVTVHVVTPRRISIQQNIADMNLVYKKYKYDIVHAHADCANSLILSVAKRNGVKVRIAHSHNTEIPVQIRDFKSFLHRGYLEWSRLNVRRIATHYMACSDKAGAWLFGKRNVYNGKVYLLNNAVDLDRFRFSDVKREQVRDRLKINGRYVIGHVGRFSPQKNHPFILDIAEEFKNKGEDVVLVLVGDGPDFIDIKELAEKRGLDNIIFYGVTDQVEDLFQSFDVFILPSLWEGLGVVIIEAQVNGLPCLVANHERVSKESAITPLVSFIPINNASEWRIELLKLKACKQRKDYTKLIREKGYDIFRECEKLQQYYTKALE